MKKISYLNFPIGIKWYITSKCNLRCTHCYLTDYTTKLPFERIERYIAYFGKKGVHSIGLLGGEPLVRNDLETILSLITEQGIHTKIATNGTLLSEERAKSLIESGCKRYQISLEGHSAELSDPVRGKGTFDESLLGASRIKSLGGWTSFAVTMSKKNSQYLLDIHKLALEAGVDQLKVGAFVPIGTGKTYRDEYALTNENVKYIKEELSILQEKHPKMQIDSAFLSKGESSCSNTTTFGCGAGTTDLIINSDLSLSACDILVEEDRTKVKVDKPEEIEYLWQNDPLFNKWRGKAPNDRTLNIKSFKEVHQEACHISYTTYKENIFVEGK
ncbi:radical SAM protein [Bacillus sp. A301a_S52]|jgi:MoaA/NifB/PqqE/SkfB family radical SAM enzyme|nr:radical SAM protein [Bacillus sp. A301a_S52]